MNYADIKYPDVANGEGVRVSLFVSGCTNNCKGCFNKEAQDFDYGQKFTDKEKQKIFEYLEKSYVKGLSILGGEPFELQNQETVLNLILEVKEKFPDKDIWIYSGSTIEQLIERHNEITDKLLKNIDILVDGPFIEDKKTLGLKFRGSSNQKIINTAEYFKMKENIEEYDEFEIPEEEEEDEL